LKKSYCLDTGTALSAWAEWRGRQNPRLVLAGKAIAFDSGQMGSGMNAGRRVSHEKPQNKNGCAAPDLYARFFLLDMYIPPGMGPSMKQNNIHLGTN
jgi:hypothetical protein